MTSPCSTKPVGFPGRSSSGIIGVAAAACLSLFWLAWAYPGGLNISPDSARYLGYALTWHHTHELQVPPAWPPLYPCLISVLLYATPFPADAAAFVSGISIFVALAAFVLILNEHNNNVALNVLILFFVFTSSAFLHVFTSILSEGPFCAFAMAAICCVIYHEKRRQMRYYACAAVCVALGALTRYLGYSLLLVFTLYTVFLLFACRGKEMRRSVAYILWNAFAYLPIGAYLARNYLTTRTLHGSRPTAETTFLENLALATDAMIADLGYPFLGLAVVTGLFCAFVLWKKRVSSLHREVAIPLLFIASFLAFYLLLLLFSTSRVLVDPIDTRMLTPVYLCAWLLWGMAFGWLERHVSCRWGRPLLFCLIVLGIVSNAHDFKETLVELTHGKAFTSAGFSRDPRSKSFRQFFSKELESRERIAITAIAQRADRPQFGQTLLFRKATVGHESFSDFRFRDVSDGGFALQFLADGKPRAISYYHLPTVNSEEKLVAKLLQLLQHNSLEEILLVAYQQERRNIAQELWKFEGEDLSITLAAEIPSFVIYRIRQRAAKLQGLEPL